MIPCSILAIKCKNLSTVAFTVSGCRNWSKPDNPWATCGLTVKSPENIGMIMKIEVTHMLCSSIDLQRSIQDIDAQICGGPLGSISLIKHSQWKLSILKGILGTQLRAYRAYSFFKYLTQLITCRYVNTVYGTMKSK